MAIVISPSGPAIRFTNNDDFTVHVTVDDEPFGDFQKIDDALHAMLDAGVLKTDPESLKRLHEKKGWN